METINERIINAVTPIVPVCVPDEFKATVGEDVSEYCTFNYTEIPDSFGDNAPEAIRYLVSVHFCAMADGTTGQAHNTLATRKALRQALFAAGFTYPSVENASDDTDQHFVFECENFDGEV